MRHKHLLLTPLFLFAFSGNIFGIEKTDTSGTLSAANSSVLFMGGERSSYATKLAEVKEEIRIFTAEVLEPHNKDAEEQRRQMTEHIAKGYDPTSEASVTAYNNRMGELNAWHDRIEERRQREGPKYADMKARESEYNAKINELENRIRELIRQYTPECLANGSIEEIVNCWAIYFDGERKREELTVVVPGTNFFGVPTVDAEAFKTYRNKQLEDINRGINRITVPKPPPPPPQPGLIEQATEKVKNYFQGIINRSKRSVNRVTAVLAVRG